jgi:membrane-associated protein
MHFSLATIIQTAGYLGILGIVFAESGLFFAFFLPGDSLLFTAGILAADGALSLPGVMATVLTGALLGGTFGYYFGKRVSATLFTRDDTFFFKKKHLERTAKFYDTHGPKAVVLARFIPIIRTFAPILAGASLMHHRKFMFWNLVGGIAWALTLPFLGYILGRRVPNIDSYLLPIVFGVMILSVLPMVYKFIKEKTNKKTG